MKMKKILAAMLCLTMIASLFSCGKTEQKDEGKASTNEQEVTTDGSEVGEDEVAKIDWKPYDELIQKIKLETDFEKRIALMHDAEDMLMDTGAVVPIYYYNNDYLLRDGVEGFYNTAHGYQYFARTTYKDNSKLRINEASEPKVLDPTRNATVDGAIFAVNLFAGLFTIDKDSKPAMDLVKEYTVSDDKKTYTFVLHDDLKWSDGSELNAKDFEYSWKRLANPETVADYSYLAEIIEGYPDNLNAKASEDGQTFEVVLKVPCSYFLELCAFPTFMPVKQDAVESAEGYKDESGEVKNPSAWTAEAGFVSNGPYTITSWVHKENIVLEKNPNYHLADEVTMNSLEFMLSDDDSVIFSAFKNGDLDYLDIVSPDEIQGIKNDKQYHVADLLGTYFMSFNVNSDMFKGKTVEQAKKMRKAISLLIDRENIIETVAQCDQKLATSFIPIGMADGHGDVFKKNSDAYTYPVGTGYYGEEPDVEGAIALLEEAGFIFDGDKLSAETPLSFEYMTNESQNHSDIAQIIQQDLAQIGIEMTLESREWAIFVDERNAGNYASARHGWVADYSDPVNMLELWSSDSGNNTLQLGK